MTSPRTFLCLVDTSGSIAPGLLKEFQALVLELGEWGVHPFGEDPSPCVFKVCTACSLRDKTWADATDPHAIDALLRLNGQWSLQEFLEQALIQGKDAFGQVDGVVVFSDLYDSPPRLVFGDGTRCPPICFVGDTTDPFPLAAFEIALPEACVTDTDTFREKAALRRFRFDRDALDDTLPPVEGSSPVPSRFRL
jgi:hypothetical protein